MAVFRDPKMKKKIVICDDEVLILDVLSLALEDENTEIIQTTKSTDLFSIINVNKPDLLIIDLQMPWQAGDQIVRELKNSKNHNQLPVIMVSASLKGEKAAAECRADAFLAKPFNLEDLYRVVKKVM